MAAYLEDTLNCKISIIVYGHKSPYMIVCFLACVKSGRAYCPVDISISRGGVETIIREVEPEAVLATEELSVDKEKILSPPSIISITQNEEKTIHKSNPVSEFELKTLIVNMDIL